MRLYAQHAGAVCDCGLRISGSEKRELKYAARWRPECWSLCNGTVTEIAENGLILAAFGYATYSDKTLSLQAGDRLLLYTDGLIEARNGQEEFFGEVSKPHYEYSQADSSGGRDKIHCRCSEMGHLAGG